MDRTRQKCLIAFGSNKNSAWGDARKTVLTALEHVQGLAASPLACSPLYATPAFPEGSGPDFVNAVAAIETALSPADLLSALHRIEADAGRERLARWGARTLDLDLIACGGDVLPDHATYQRWHDLPLAEQMQRAPQDLILPHPRLQDRAFVLVPLCDVAPDWIHPVLGKTAAQLCAALPAADSASVVLLDKGEN
ncbi:MAG: 2-amino-4-hydroxy-6-hydroxymethyldihydropteridine diphosphokinase [Yoonia sp.]|uniref:2-amino-4-hydroxy-6- hydroxymethyldihydropteridine diphosphokinase n=1 Tax=Yoonia sp. TaxID=2212373 RepID=UPI003EF788E4